MRLLIRLTIAFLACAASYEICANGSLAAWARHAGRLEVFLNIAPSQKPVFINSRTRAHHLMLRVIRRPRIWCPPLPSGPIYKPFLVSSRHATIAFYYGSMGGVAPLFSYYNGFAAVSRFDMATVERCIGKNAAAHLERVTNALPRANTGQRTGKRAATHRAEGAAHGK